MMAEYEIYNINDPKTIYAINDDGSGYYNSFKAFMIVVRVLSAEKLRISCLREVRRYKTLSCSSSYSPDVTWHKILYSPPNELNIRFILNSDGRNNLFSQTILLPSILRKDCIQVDNHVSPTETTADIPPGSYASAITEISEQVLSSSKSLAMGAEGSIQINNVVSDNKRRNDDLERQLNEYKERRLMRELEREKQQELRLAKEQERNKSKKESCIVS